ncbi:hypothetical protein CUMW_194510 [Citrus unshiu]|nr:hypothetical protein CUMW_194510 [Citrus unshiu]
MVGNFEWFKIDNRDLCALRCKYEKWSDRYKMAPARADGKKKGPLTYRALGERKKNAAAVESLLPSTIHYVGNMGRELPKDSAESHEMEDVNISDLELVYHVREALTSVQSGDNDNYNQLVADMHLSGCLDPDNRALLKTSLKALSGAVSYIDISHHESLLVSIFGMSMWNSDPDIMDAMKGLIISLAASDGKYVDSCLTMLVSNFTPPSYFLDKLKEPHGIERKHQVLSRVHAALKSISDLVPLAPMRLLPIVLQRMPTVHNKHERVFEILLQSFQITVLNTYKSKFAQAIMYVLCFRMRSIMDIPRLKSRLLLMPLETVLKHDLNPLKVCLPSVVSEFLQQSKAAHLFTVSESFIFSDMLESELSRAFGGLERLDMFFPFDPCLLKKSDSDEDVDEDNGDHLMVDGMGRSPDEQDLDLDEFDYALNKMSITPKNSFSCRLDGQSRQPMEMPSRIRPSTSLESL